MSAFDIPVAKRIIDLLEQQRGVQRAIVAVYYDRHLGRVPVALVMPKKVSLLNLPYLAWLLEEHFDNDDLVAYVLPGQVSWADRWAFKQMANRYEREQADHVSAAGVH